VSWFSSPAEWAFLARALGFAAFAPTARYGAGTGFRSMKRALGVPAPPQPSFQHWLYGTRHGTEVLVFTYDVGSGSSSQTWTGAMARLDPPLFLGLGIGPQGWLHGVFGNEDIKIGEPSVDEKLLINGSHPARVAKLLAPYEPGGRDVLMLMLRAMALDTLSVVDSSVTLSRSGTLTDVGAINVMVEGAVAIARALAARGQSLEPTPGEAAQRAAWQRFADAARFTFDPARMKLAGDRRGTSVEIALETEGREIKTAVTARFPRSVDVGFTALRTNAPAFLQGLFSQDIIVGDPMFDAQYKVTGHPEHAVRAVLARPNVLMVMKQLAMVTSEIQLNHRELFFRLRGGSSGEAELAQLADMGARVTADLFAEVGSVGPYR
jgi:hypothetical protein